MCDKTPQLSRGHPSTTAGTGNGHPGLSGRKEGRPVTAERSRVEWSGVEWAVVEGSGGACARGE